MFDSENLRDKSLLRKSAGKCVAAENVAMPLSRNKKKEDDKNKNKKKDANETKSAAKNEIKTARKITEFLKPKPEHPGIPNTVKLHENLEPGTALAGIPAFRLGSRNKSSSGEIRKPDFEYSDLGTTLNLSRGLAEADCDWPDGPRRTRLSQSE